jgi:hypothetical protein
MPSLLNCVPAVNPAFSRPTASLAGVELFHASNGIAVLTLATGKGRSPRLKTYHVEEVPSAIGGRAFCLASLRGLALAWRGGLADPFAPN